MECATFRNCCGGVSLFPRSVFYGPRANPFNWVWKPGRCCRWGAGPCIDGLAAAVIAPSQARQLSFYYSRCTTTFMPSPHAATNGQYAFTPSKKYLDKWYCWSCDKGRSEGALGPYIVCHFCKHDTRTEHQKRFEREACDRYNNNGNSSRSNSIFVRSQCGHGQSKK